MPEDIWEYRVETLGGLFQSFNLEQRLKDLLNRLGRESWELISTQRTRLTQRYTLQLRRRRREATSSLSVA